MSIYIAGKFTSKERLAGIRERVRRMGYTVSSTWLDEPETDYSASVPYKVECAHRDLEEIEAAQCLIIDTLDVSDTGGREVEFGFALHKGITVIVVGPERNVFHYIANAQYDDWDACVEALGESRRRGF